MDALATAAADICAKVTTATAKTNATAGKEQKRNMDEMEEVLIVIL